MSGYRLVLHGEVAKLLLAFPARRRNLLIRFFDELAENPFQAGDFEMVDGDFRSQQVKLHHGFVITFYADHAVKELRVTELEIP